ncbi:MAG: hypothetical protein JWQ78_1927, partial [Sediminibacterium sp.]|nr:hypothetical protein [Sediminibacterium sp.]
HAVNDPGYGTTEAAVNLVKNGPKWAYRRGNEEAIRITMRKAITFILPEKGNRP